MEEVEEAEEERRDAFVHSGAKSSPLHDAELERLLSKLSAVSSHLQSVQLPHNRLTWVSANSIVLLLESCPTLEKLDVSHNSLKALGAHLIVTACQGHPAIRSLNLSANGIDGRDSKGVMRLLLGPSSPLTRIHLSENRLLDEGAAQLASWLRPNKRLRELSLRYCSIGEKGLCALLEAVQGNDTLQTLLLRKNPFSTQLRKSKELQSKAMLAVLRNCSLVGLSLPVLGSLNRDEMHVVQEQNRVFSIARSGSKQHNAYFAERMWSSIPQAIIESELLVSLDVSHNRLAGLPYSIIKLVNLEKLNIADNDMEMAAVPVHLQQLTRLSVLRVENNPFAAKLRTTLSVERLFQFFEACTERYNPCSEVKVIVLGHPGAGKSTLVRTLERGEQRKMGRFAQSMKKLKTRIIELITTRKWTDGISITDVSLQGDAEEEENAMVFKFWDFAGQETYYPTHQFFLSDDSLYVLAVNPLAQDWAPKLDYWLDTLDCKVESADIVIVVTHLDRAPLAQSVAQSVQQRFVEPRKYKKASRSKKIHAVLTVNATSYSSLAELRLQLVTLGSALTKRSELYPHSWALLGSMLKEERGARSYPAITWKEFCEMAAASNVEEDEVELAARFLHRTGTILYFHWEQALRSTIVLEPAWLVTVMARLVTDKQTPVSENGTFHSSELSNIWPGYEFPGESLPVIISLLENFQVLNSLGNLFVVPCLVPDLPPSEVPEEVAVGEGTHRYHRFYEFTFQFVPHGFVSQLIIRLLGLATHTKSIWRNGVVFDVEERGFCHGVRVQFIPASAMLDMQVTTNDDTGKILYLLHRTVESLLDGWYSHIAFSSYIVDGDGQKVALDDITTALMKMGDKLDVALDAELVPDLLMRNTYRVDWDDVEEDDFIASGAFGSVYHGYHRGEECVVKRMMTLENLSEPQMYQQFLLECWMLSFLQHPCVIRMIGISIEPLAILLEYMNQRDLRWFLDQYKLPPLAVRANILMDVALGMEYAHAQFPPIIHRDLKSPNVFVRVAQDGTLRAKVADLGLATVLPRLLKHAVVENPTWSAPEVNNALPYSRPADVYSFGIIMSELLTGRFPFAELWDECGGFGFAVVNRINEGRRPLVTSQERASAPAAFANLMEECWRDAPQERPTFRQIVQRIAVLQRELPLPAKCVASSHTPSLLPLSTPPSLRMGHGGVVGGQHLLYMSDSGKFSVMSLESMEVQRFSFPSAEFPHTPIAAVATEYAVWFIDGKSSRVLALEPNGTFHIVVLENVLRATTIFAKDEQHLVVAGEVQEQLGKGKSLVLQIHSVEKKKKVLAKVNGVMTCATRVGLSPVFGCDRSNSNFLYKLKPSGGAEKREMHTSVTQVCSVAHLDQLWCIMAPSFDSTSCSVMVYGGTDMRVRVHDIAADTGIMVQLLYIKDRRLLFSAGWSAVAIWDAEAGEIVKQWPLTGALGRKLRESRKRNAAFQLLYSKQHDEVLVMAEGLNVWKLDFAAILDVSRSLQKKADKELRASTLIETRLSESRAKMLQEESRILQDTVASGPRSFSFATDYTDRYDEQSRPMGLVLDVVDEEEEGAERAGEAAAMGSAGAVKPLTFTNMFSQRHFRSMKRQSKHAHAASKVLLSPQRVSVDAGSATAASSQGHVKRASKSAEIPPSSPKKKNTSGSISKSVSRVSLKDNRGDAAESGTPSSSSSTPKLRKRRGSMTTGTVRRNQASEPMGLFGLIDDDAATMLQSRSSGSGKRKPGWLKRGTSRTSIHGTSSSSVRKNSSSGSGTLVRASPPRLDVEIGGVRMSTRRGSVSTIPQVPSLSDLSDSVSSARGSSLSSRESRHNDSPASPPSATRLSPLSPTLTKRIDNPNLRKAETRAGRTNSISAPSSPREIVRRVRSQTRTVRMAESGAQGPRSPERVQELKQLRSMLTVPVRETRPRSESRSAPGSQRGSYGRSLSPLFSPHISVSNSPASSGGFRSTDVDGLSSVESDQRSSLHLIDAAELETLYGKSESESDSRPASLSGRNRLLRRSGSLIMTSKQRGRKGSSELLSRKVVRRSVEESEDTIFAADEEEHVAGSPTYDVVRRARRGSGVVGGSLAERIEEK